VASTGTYSDDPSAAVEVVLRGPCADDGEFLSGFYRLRREVIHGDEGALHEGLEEWEKRLLVERIKDLSPTPNNPWRLALRALAGLLKLPHAA
jgi:hypothetical protein